MNIEFDLKSVAMNKEKIYRITDHFPNATRSKVDFRANRLNFSRRKTPRTQKIANLKLIFNSPNFKVDCGIK